MLVVKNSRSGIAFWGKRDEKMEYGLQILNKARESTHRRWKASLLRQNHLLVVPLPALSGGIQLVLSFAVLRNVKSVFLPQFVIRRPLLLNCVDLCREEK